MNVPSSFWIALPLVTIGILVIIFLLYHYLYLPHCEKTHHSPKLKYWMLVIVVIISSIGVGVGVPVSNYLYEQQYIYNTELYTGNNINTFFKKLTYNTLKETLDVDDNLLYADVLRFAFSIDEDGMLYPESEFADGYYLFTRNGRALRTVPIFDGSKMKFTSTEFTDYSSYDYLIPLSYFGNVLENFDFDLILSRYTSIDLMLIRFYDAPSLANTKDPYAVKTYETAYFTEIKDNKLIEHDEQEFSIDGCIIEISVRSKYLFDNYILGISKDEALKDN